MDTLTFGLSQQIGIWYKESDWMFRIFDDIIKHYPPDWFTERGIIRSIRGCYLSFKDGSTIKFVRANENERGHCFSKVIIQPGIDHDFVRQYIMPSLKHGNRKIMVLNDEGINIMSFVTY